MLSTKIHLVVVYYFLSVFHPGTPLWSTSTGSSSLPKECHRLKTSINFGDSMVMLGGNNGTEQDNGFEIRVRRASDGVMVSGWYESGREYAVTLINRYPSVGFRDAVIWLNFDDGDKFMKPMNGNRAKRRTKRSLDTQQSSSCIRDPIRLGMWIHKPGGESSTQPRAGCQGLTAERYNSARSLVTKLALNWRAPDDYQSLSRCKRALPLGCVLMQAAVQARGGHDSVYAVSGGLSKRLCPSWRRPPSPVLPAYIGMHSEKTHSNEPKSVTPNNGVKLSAKDTKHMDTMQPPDCCACGTATYNLTFKGLWTRKTHPRDWPVHNPGLLHWTNLIGASHMPGYRIYQFGEPASAGVSAVCAYGDTTVLKQSLGIAASSTGSVSSVPTGTQRGAMGIGPLHSLISTPGMWSEETLDESRSTLVAVNRTHPLISFLTMLGPSPNWCAGVASQSVCQADCTWIKQLQIDLFPWDAGVRYGDTYIPKSADRKDIPDPIRYITFDWMPNHPFTPNLPVARVTLERVLPKESWQCTSEPGVGVELFRSDGTTETVGGKAVEGERDHTIAQSVIGDPVGGVLKKSRSKSGGHSAGGVGLAGDNPLSDPSLAQMATFLCITDQWSPWGQCSVTCGVGRRERRRLMISNKKNELCQHVPLVEEELCEGRKRTCDFSAPCSLLPWTEWTPCNATCDNRAGLQTRRRYLARPEELDHCRHLFRTQEELDGNTVVEKRECGPTDNECDPVTICGEGRKDGIPCGKKMWQYYYSAVEHDCLPFEYLGCKGGRNRFRTKEACRSMCLKVVESLPGWRRERMALLQYQTSQISSEGTDESRRKSMKAALHCAQPMDPGQKCSDGADKLTGAWYYSPRNRRCFEFLYLGCGGNQNRYADYTSCISDCMPEEWEKSLQMAKALAATGKQPKHKDEVYPTDMSIDSTNPGTDSATMLDKAMVESLRGPKQDCQLTAWGGWSPCSVSHSHQTGRQRRWRHILRSPRHGGSTCGRLFEERACTGTF
ncbi:spondin-1 [Clonorchis sinensis]|uniref:Spondin-1 n=1 Tax=Clonorchis sinensis TaxID=79923 RepID=G7YEU5_CLOSI|nr:spondin-1 [Clonorchis sinensis]